MTEVQISKDISGKITVSFPYNPQLVQKVKTIPGHRWHPAEKYRGFPDTDGTLERIKKVFNGEETKVDPALEVKSSNLPISNNKFREMKAEQTWFEDLRKELISRKYSCKTVKAYLFYNKYFLNFTRKPPDEVAWLRPLMCLSARSARPLRKPRCRYALNGHQSNMTRAKIWEQRGLELK